MTEGPKGMPGPSLLSLGSVCSVCPLTPGVQGPFCCLCMWLESPSTPAHGQTTAQAEGKSHPNTTAEHTQAFSGMTHALKLSVHKSEGGERSNEQPLPPCCGLHVEHLHTQVIYCVYRMTPKYPWCGVLINFQG